MTARLLVLLAACVAVAGCGGGQSNKAGAPTGKPVTLRLAVPDAGDEGAAYFARAVARALGREP